MKKILILQAYSDQAHAIAKYIKLYSNNFFIVGGVDENYTRDTPLQYFDSLKKISSYESLDLSDYDYVLPTGAESTNSLINYFKSIQIGCYSFNKENLRACDKIPMLDFINDLSIPIPETYRSIEEIKNFPVFYKQRLETGYGARGIVRNQGELEKISKDPSVFFQEFIDSPITYGVGFLAKDGILITSFIHKELYSYPKAGGMAVALQSFDDDRLKEYVQKILKKMNFNGWGLVEFKFCQKRKDYAFMEVNPKLWASVEFALMNNPEFLKELFSITYNPKKVPRLVYLDRLALYGIRDYFSLGLLFINYKKLNFRKSILVLAHPVISKISTFIKK